MDSILKTIKGFAKFIVMGGFAAYAIWSLVNSLAGGIGDSFLAVVAALLLMLLIFTLFGFTVVFLAMDNEKAASVSFAITVSFGLITNVVSGLSLFSLGMPNVPVMYIIGAIFQIIASLAIFAIIVMYLLDIGFGMSLKGFIPFAAVGAIGCLFIGSIFMLIAYGQLNGMAGYSYFDWNDFVQLIFSGMLMPSVYFAGYLLFYHDAK